MSEHKQYSMGFYYIPGVHPAPDRVILILKTSGSHKGNFNGIGGQQLEGENRFSAMVREFEEETGIVTGVSDWSLAMRVGGHNEQEGYTWTLDLFFTTGKQEPKLVTIDEGTIHAMPITTLPDNMDRLARWAVLHCYDRLTGGFQWMVTQ